MNVSGHPLLAISLLATLSVGAPIAAAHADSSIARQQGDVAPKIFFTRPKGNTIKEGVWVMSAAGVKQHRIRPEGYHPAVERRGTNHVAYDRGNSIWVATKRGTHVRRIARRGETPTWAPMGRRLAYARIAGTFGISVVRADGTHAHAITHDNGVTPSWAPHGRRIVYALGHQESTKGLRMVDANGKHRHWLTRAGNDADPAWSPRGNKIVYDRYNETTGHEVWVIDADGTNAHRLAIGSQSAGFGGPSWSPDGRRIAFTRDDDGVGEVWVMNSDGSNQHRIARRAGAPAWLN